MLLKTAKEFFEKWKLPAIQGFDPTAQAILACTFSDTVDQRNQTIANCVMYLCEKHQLPYCVHGPVGTALYPNWCERQRRGGYVGSVPNNRHRGKYVATRMAIAEMTREYLQSQQITRVHVVVPRRYTRHVIRVCKTFGVQVVSLTTDGIQNDQ